LSRERDICHDRCVPEATVEVREPGRVALRLVLSSPLVIGRDCDGLLLNDGQISRRHVELRPTTRGVEVTDLGSTNGSYLDGARLTGPAVLSTGSELKLGAVTVRLVPTEPARVGTQTALVPSIDFRRTAIDDVADEVIATSASFVDDEHRHGTVTIVFSDIEGSTSRVSEMGDSSWMQLLSTHNQVVRRALARFGGTEVKSQGDGFMLTFPSSRRAVQAMTTVQQELADPEVRSRTGDLRIRVGMHTGEVIVDDEGDLFGRHVNLAARIAGHAEGGEILVSSLTKALLETRGDMSFGEPREAELKGIPGVHEMHPVTWLAPA
jgi:class 3 adenylate cyclase